MKKQNHGRRPLHHKKVSSPSAPNQVTQWKWRWRYHWWVMVATQRQTREEVHKPCVRLGKGSRKGGWGGGRGWI